MGTIDKLKLKFWDSVGATADLIKKWKPRKCKTEKDFEKSLYNFLHDQLDSIQITKQYAKGRIRADLVIEDKVIIELKNNLDSTAKYKRLIGQLTEYEEWEGQIIVLLTGKTDPNLKKQLDKFVQDRNSDSIFDKNLLVLQK